MKVELIRDVHGSPFASAEINDNRIISVTLGVQHPDEPSSYYQIPYDTWRAINNRIKEVSQGLEEGITQINAVK